jgi:hypothetical protein
MFLNLVAKANAPQDPEMPLISMSTSFCNIFVVYPLCCETKGMSKKAMYFGVFYRYNREFTIYDAAGSPTRFQNKECE